MTKTKSEKLKAKNQNLKLRTFGKTCFRKNILSFTFYAIVLHFTLFAFSLKVLAISPTITPKPSPAPTLAKKTTVTPIASPSANLTPASPASPRGEPTASQGGPTTIEDSKVKEIRDSLTATGIQEKLNQIKEKIEKKAYVGTILEITDSTLSISNFRGKQRVRLTKDTKIILPNKKEGTVKDLAVEDKIIALGEIDANGTLEAKRVVAIAKPKIVPPKRLVFFGTITEIDTKASTLTLTAIKNLDQTVLLKIDKETNLTNPKDLKATIKLKDLQENQKLVVIYPEPAEGKTALAKTIFILP